MFRIDDATAAAALPSMPAAGTPGYFTEGNPGTGVPATVVPDWWLNQIQEEIIHVLSQASVTPAKGTNTQLYQAVQALIDASVPELPASVLSLSLLLLETEAAWRSALQLGTVATQDIGTAAGNVPALAGDGKLLQTVIRDMAGATSGAAGVAGAVPAPAAGDQDKILNGAGQWVEQYLGLPRRGAISLVGQPFVEFTNVPAVDHIVVGIIDYSHPNGGQVLVQLGGGTPGTVESTGYVGGSGYQFDTTPDDLAWAQNITSGFTLALNTPNGSMTGAFGLYRYFMPAAWLSVAQAFRGDAAGQGLVFGSGRKVVGGEVNTVRVGSTAVGNHIAGTAAIFY